jgi:hypothetical protein
VEDIHKHDPEVKILALEAFDSKVYASRDKTEIRGVIPLELALPTNKRTSGCFSSDVYKYLIPFAFSIE